MSDCSHCGVPLSGPGRSGRDGACYCCFGCLSLGERGGAAPRGWVGARLGVGLLVAGQSMIYGLALNLHDDVPADVRRAAQSLLLLAALLVVALLGGPLFRTAWGELRRGRPTTEALFLLTMVGALGASLQALVSGRGPVYFEVVSVLLAVYTIGKVVGARGKAAALAASRAWSGRLSTCRVIDGTGAVRTVPVAEVRPGDRVEVRPGEAFAVDGIVREGTGFAAEAAVSGEPFAVVRRPGDRVLAGAASYDAAFVVEATAAGTDRQVDRLLAAVEAARAAPASMQARADALGRVLFPAVALAAVGTFGYWSSFTAGGWEAGLFNAMSVLLVACPCAIGLAAPIAVWSAMNRLAERGLVVSSGDAIERLAAVDRVAFDKTGTLTEDRFAVVDAVTSATGTERAKVLGWLALVQRGSRHPIARAFAELPLQSNGEETPRVREARAVPGCGVTAEIEEANGARHAVLIGRPEWVAELTGEAPPAALAAGLLAAGHRIDAAIDGRLAAVVAVAERLRESAAEAIAEFRRMGLPVEVLTGDAAGRAAALHLPETGAGLLPDDKRRRLEGMRGAGGRPLMVGDGINDAAALAAAHVGVALSSGTDLAVGAADATLYGGDLRVLPWAVAESRAAVRAVRRNLGRAVAYNLVGVALAAGGALHPVAAALLMVASSLTLVFSSARLGAAGGHCTAATASPAPTSKAFLHGLAIALQGAALVALLEPLRTAAGAVAAVGGFAAAGAALAYVWWRWESIPHSIDMAFGMLALGNLGMLLGWWADLGFGPIRCARCCAADGPLSMPWMGLGMLAFAGAAMARLGRRPPAGHPWETHLASNAGMLLGMYAGGWAAAQAECGSDVAGALLGFLGMTAGMVLGMLAGHGLGRAGEEADAPAAAEATRNTSVE